MSTASWLEIGQFTFALVVAWCAARLWLTRQPQIAARICLVGLVLSTILALFMLLAVPRPFTYKPDRVSATSAIGSTSKPIADGPVTNGSLPLPAVDTVPNTTNVEQPRGLDLRVAGKQMLYALRSISRKSQEHPFIFRIIGLGIALGISLQLCLVGFGTWELARLSRLASDVVCPLMIAKLKRLCEQGNIAEPPRLRIHPFEQGAFVSWLDPHTIYLPSSYTTWTAEELDAALAHELMHVARHDGWWRYVSRVCAGVLWFHPGAWLLHRQLCLAQEASADRLASHLIPGEGYLVGLAKLGLRLDGGIHRQMPNLCVSVFTKDLIRRIKMLKQTQGMISRPNRHMARATLAAVLVFCATNLCWTVDADEADEAIRIASRVVPDTSQAKLDSFQKPRLKPWQVVPAAEGYAAIRVSEMREHPTLSLLLAAGDSYVANALSRSGMEPTIIESITKHGVHLQNVAAAQVNIDVKLYSRTSESDSEADVGSTANGDVVDPVPQQMHCLAVAAHQIVIDTVAPIDWRAITSMIPVGQLTEWLKNNAGPVEQPKIQELFDSLASLSSDKTRFSLHTEPSCGDSVDSSLAGVWDFVDGGLVTLAINCQEALKPDEDETTVTGFFSMSSTSTTELTDAPEVSESAVAEMEQRKLMKMIGYLGIGIDETPTSNELQVRVVCTPIDATSVDDLESQWNRFAAAALPVLESEESMELTSDDAYSLNVARLLLKMQCQRISGEGKSTLKGLTFSGRVPLP